MKWFQHMSDAHDDEFIRELMHKFGADGYAAWFVTAELVSKIVKVTPTPGVGNGYKVSAKFEASSIVFIEATKIAGDRLERIYEFCARRRKFLFKRTKERWIVEWPKLLEFKDNATSDAISRSGKSLGSELPSALGSDLVVASGGGVVPLGYNGDLILRGGAGGGEGSGDDASFAKRVAEEFGKWCHSPGLRARRNAIQDLLRQGVPRPALEDAPKNKVYQRMDFYEVVRDLKNSRPNGTGGGHGGSRAIGEFGLQTGKLEGSVDQRIREREDGSGTVHKEGERACEAGNVGDSSAPRSTDTA